MKTITFSFLLLAAVATLVSASDNSLRSNFTSRLSAICDTSDCTVGVAIRDPGRWPRWRYRISAKDIPIDVPPAVKSSPVPAGSVAVATSITPTLIV